MRDTDTEDEYPRESRKRLTSCTDERNILWYFEMVNPFWYFFSVFLITYTMVRYIIAFRRLKNINCLDPCDFLQIKTFPCVRHACAAKLPFFAIFNSQKSLHPTTHLPFKTYFPCLCCTL